jgi:hypothetical protein
MTFIYERSLESRSKLDKTKEWVNDTATEIMSRVAGDRTNVPFYSCVMLLCGLLVAMFIVGKEEVADFTMSEAEGLMGVTIQSKVPLQDLLQPVPTNVNIVIIGDSLSRYGYLSLVYFLRWGRWFEPLLEKSNLMDENSFKSLFHQDAYGEFYFQSSRLLQPYELCDCYKGDHFEEGPAMASYVIENRYYHDPELNNTVTFLHAFGHQSTIHGRIRADEAYDTAKWNWHKEEKKLVQHKFTEPVWSFTGWNDVAERYVSELDPKPEFAVVNAGEWSNNFGPKGEEVSREFALAMEDQHFQKAIWKTTTFRAGGKPMTEDAEATDKYMCDLLPDCFDISWTKDLRDDLYWDEKHFYEPVYRVINEELLETMGYLPRGYTKYDKQKLLKNGNYEGEQDDIHDKHFTTGDAEDDGSSGVAEEDGSGTP